MTSHLTTIKHYKTLLKSYLQPALKVKIHPTVTWLLFATLFLPVSIHFTSMLYVWFFKFLTFLFLKKSSAPSSYMFLGFPPPFLLITNPSYISFAIHSSFILSISPEDNSLCFQSKCTEHP